MSDLGLSIAVSGLFAQKKCIEVISQNIANASTEGYSRQRAVLATADPQPAISLQMGSGPGQFGTGVEVETVSRVRDLYLDQQIRRQNGLQGEWQQRSDALSQVETIFNEPSDSGLSSALSSFWDAWNNLSEASDSDAARATVAEASETLADALRNTYGQLQTLQGNLNGEISIEVDSVNDVLVQLGALNKQIQIASISGLTPNDLMDQRDSLLNDLSQTVEIQATFRDDNTVTVAIGNAKVVDGQNVTKLKVVTDSEGNNQVGFATGGSGNIIPWSELGGELQGLAHARDVDVAGYMTGLDELASTFADQVNSQHMAGYGLGGETGIPFFVGSDSQVTSATESDLVTSAASIYVNPYITENEGRIAAASALATDSSGQPASGDNGNALLIYQLKDQAMSFLDASGAVVSTSTADDFYDSMISRLGVDSSEAGNMVTNQEALLEQLNNKQDSVSGVSLDEEIASLIQYQSAYEAAAKLINVIDEMMTTVISLGSIT